jgi:hypothetical protein
MSSDNQNSYETLEPPKEFKSSIPPHLLEKLSDSDRWLVETMSRLENQNNWMLGGLLRVNKDVLDCDRRLIGIRKDVSTISDWKQLMSGKWAVIGVVTVIVLPVVLKFVLDLLWHLWKI